MSRPQPVELNYLKEAEAALRRCVKEAPGRDQFEIRLQVLEATAAHFGGFDLERFHNAFAIKSARSASVLLKVSSPVVSAIDRSRLHPSLALSVLARETLQEHETRRTGAYHTDFRLAMRLAESAAARLTHTSKVIDPACGAGILLVALTRAVCGADREKVAYWLRHGVTAADLSENSLRASVLSLASLTNDVGALVEMRRRWRCQDSLIEGTSPWRASTPLGFDAVIGNPPWEKVKISRHEFLKASGAARHYGAATIGLDEKRFARKRAQVSSYSKALLQRYPSLAQGEPDLYIAFTDLFFDLCKPGGVVAAILPGGFIRSQGTAAIRKHVFESCSEVMISVLDNRARFFSIDTRFKFLLVNLVKQHSPNSPRKAITLSHESGAELSVESLATCTIGRAKLRAVSPSLSIPEVRTPAEWKLYCKIHERGIPWLDDKFGWSPAFCREVDMTKDRPNFLRHAAEELMPLVEGRMVQAHRLGAKGHVGGSGRSAQWHAYPVGTARISPQFWIHPGSVGRANRTRTRELRVGFCDITGQTNERSLMAAIIPPGVVCGNKVPTLQFPADLSLNRLLVWTAIANSFVFDWMLRRNITTTVNYFLLESIPLPRLQKSGLPWRRLCTGAARLRAMSERGSSYEVFEEIPRIRAEIDVEIAVAYGLDVSELELVFNDFPLLDRQQPAIRGESRSTITRDTVLAGLAKRTGCDPTYWLERIKEAKTFGAVAYIPSEFQVPIKGGDSYDRECGDGEPRASGRSNSL